MTFDFRILTAAAKIPVAPDLKSGINEYKALFYALRRVAWDKFKAEIDPETGHKVIFVEGVTTGKIDQLAAADVRSVQVASWYNEKRIQFNALFERSIPLQPTYRGGLNYEWGFKQLVTQVHLFNHPETDTPFTVETLLAWHQQAKDAWERKNAADTMIEEAVDNTPTPAPHPQSAFSRFFSAPF